MSTMIEDAAVMEPLIEPEAEYSGDIPEPPQRLTIGVNGESCFVETDLVATGFDAPGQFSSILKTPSRSGAWILSAAAASHSGRYQVNLKARGMRENIEHLLACVENDERFPRVRPPFTINDVPSQAVACTRYEIYAEAEDDAQIANVLDLLSRRDINVSTLEMRLDSGPISGDVVKARLRLGSEMKIDVPINRKICFSDVKAELVELMAYDKYLRVWGPVREGAADGVPPWKEAYRKLWK